MANTYNYKSKYANSYGNRNDDGSWSTTRQFYDNDGNVVRTSTLSSNTAKGSLGSTLGGGSKTTANSSATKTGSGNGTASGYSLDTSSMPTWNSSGSYNDIAKPSYIAGTAPNLNVDNSKSTSWANELENIYNQIKNREAFNYDQSSDPLYQQYAEMYANNAKLAMQDTVGQVASMTGGYGNSYAETAGQAMYNQQMDNLNSKALELYNAAENTYNNETNRLMNNYSLANSQYGNALNAENTQYARLLDQYNIENALRQEQNEYNWNQYNTDLSNYWNQQNFDYGVYSDQLNNWWNTQNFNYNAYRDSVADDQWNKTFNYQQERDAKSDELDWAKFNWQKEADQRDFDYTKSQNDLANDWAEREFAYQQGRDEKSDYWTQQNFDESVRQYEADRAYNYDRLAEDQRQFNKNLAYNKESNDYENQIKTLQGQVNKSKILEGNTQRANSFIGQNYLPTLSKDGKSAIDQNGRNVVGFSSGKTTTVNGVTAPAGDMSASEYVLQEQKKLYKKIDKSNLTEAEKVYLINYYGLTDIVV